MKYSDTGKPRIAIVGSRGVPAKYGGFETFAEELSSLLAEAGYEVTVQCDHNSYSERRFRNVNLFYTSVEKTDHPLKYYFEGIRWAVNNSDIIFVTSSAGSYFYFLNFLRKKIIVTNPDGLEFKRAKWSLPKKIYLKLSEKLAVKISDYIVADSEAIKKYLNTSYRNIEQKIRVIEYGAYPNTTSDPAILSKYGLEKGSYYLVVSRLEPENNLDMIIRGFKDSETQCPLVIVGQKLDNSYVRDIISCTDPEKFRFLGAIYDRNELNTLRNSCRAYVHGHSVGGTNPSLLEAMGNRNIILAHDNEFNREVTSGGQLYFKTDSEFSERISHIEKMPEAKKEELRLQSFKMISDKYNWGNILKKYLSLIEEIGTSSE